jgi:hypothetical protein
MPDPVFEELSSLFGKHLEAPEVTAFLSRYPDHKVSKPSDGRQYVEARKSGFSLLFGLPDGTYSGGRTGPARVLITIFLNSGAVPRYQPFAKLPFEISFADRHDELVAKLGPPAHTWTTASGAPRSDRWRIGELVFDADYTADLQATRIFTLMTPAVAQE